jgi:hypothetical protein
MDGIGAEDNGDAGGLSSSLVPKMVPKVGLTREIQRRFYDQEVTRLELR